MTRDARDKTFAVELGFHVWLDEQTLVIGVQDRIAEDKDGYYGCEWKTAKEPKKNRNGEDSAWWNERVWENELTNGPQLAIYALAQNRGTFFRRDGTAFHLGVSSPRIYVRAVVKSVPCVFWGDKMVSFSEAQLENTVQGLLTKAETIRRLRRYSHVPWQLPGKQCFAFNRECGLFEKWCGKGLHPTTVTSVRFDPGDPAATLALPHLPASVWTREDLVILSASSYTTASDCLEKYRIISGALTGGGKDSSLELDTGTVLHAGVAEAYRQLM